MPVIIHRGVVGFEVIETQSPDQVEVFIEFDLVEQVNCGGVHISLLARAVVDDAPIERIVRIRIEKIRGERRAALHPREVL